MKRPMSQFIHRRYDLRMPQQALWSRYDEWFSQPAPVRSAEHLPAQKMEVLRRRGRIRDTHVVLRTKLEEPFQAGTRMLRPLPLLSMRKQQDQTARLSPLRLRSGQKLIDDDLRAVGEIAELRFPQHQSQ